MSEGGAQAAHEEAGSLDWTERSQPAGLCQGQYPLADARWDCRCTMAPEPLVAVGDKFSPSEYSTPCTAFKNIYSAEAMPG